MSAAKPMCQYCLSTRLSPSSEALNVRELLAAPRRTALMRKASSVTLTPSDFAFSSLTRARKASRSVMSASSNCVTCGIITQLRASAGPEIFLMRESGCSSIGPNFAKSTFGHAGQAEVGEAAAGGARRALAGAREAPAFTKPCDVLLEDAALGAAARDRGRGRRPARGRSARTPGLAWAGAPPRSRRRARRRHAERGRCGGGDGAGGAAAAAGAAGVRPARVPAAAAWPARRCRLSRRRRSASQDEHEGSLAHLVAHLHLQFLHHAGRRSRALPSSPCRSPA